MNTFLDSVCNEIIKKHKENLPDICIVFPSRRAGLYFKNLLGKKFTAPVWSPQVFSIEDFIENLSGYSFAGNLKLLIELFTVYTGIISEEKITFENGNDFIESSDDYEDFDTFYPWGEMLLKDFDIVDKYLVDAGVLFRRIKDLKEIEESFPVELHDAFKKFWGTLFENNPTSVKNNFLKIWQILEKLYSKFKDTLNRQNISYPGMAYRKLYEDIKSGSLDFKWKKIIFAGFNSLSTSEKNIMQILADKGVAEIFWDADEYYYSDINQEAGNFIRKNIKFFGQNEVNFENNISGSKKNIYSIGVSSSAGMAKSLGSELKELSGQVGFNPDRTVVVLPEENLLLPVLYSIPDEIKSINVTMGLPFRDTPLYGLIDLLTELQKNCIYENGRYKFYFKEVEKILLHPYLKFTDTGEIYNIINHIKKNNIFYFSSDEYIGDISDLLKIIFRKISTAAETETYLKDIVGFISERIGNDKNKDDDYKKFQLEYIYYFYSNFNCFSDIIRDLLPEIKTETYRRLLKDTLSNVSIPFTGEPLKGLQIMGLLESRNLDFENVIILSVNEGVLPKGNTHNSFIPYSLRKAMRMPTYEDEDSITAYYFYRLLQRTNNVYLIYNTDMGNNAKEKSRYVLQIENELVPRSSKINYTDKIVIPESFNIEKKPIEIKKDDPVISKLNELKYFSPSALNKYINCPLSFYFEKIAGIKEEEEAGETFDSRLIGNVLHKILEMIFKPYEGKEVDGKTISLLIDLIEKDFPDILEKAVRDCGSEYVLKEFSGKNLLFKDIIYQLLKRVLENEKTEVPFKIISLEKEIDDNFDFLVDGTMHKVKIHGRIDRIDKKDNIFRIIDYKTGGFELKKFNEKNTEDYFEQLIVNPDYKENLQAFFYGYFYSKISQEKKIIIGIYPIKKLSDGINNLKDGFIGDDLFEMFEEKLRKLFVEIYNPEIPFKQTDDEKRCSYCPYAGLCYRDLKNTI